MGRFLLRLSFAGQSEAKKLPACAVCRVPLKNASHFLLVVFQIKGQPCFLTDKAVKLSFANHLPSLIFSPMPWKRNGGHSIVFFASKRIKYKMVALFCYFVIVVSKMLKAPHICVREAFKSNAWGCF